MTPNHKLDLDALPDGVQVQLLFAADPQQQLLRYSSPNRRRQRGKRKPRIDAMIRQAERTGKQVTSITTADGITLTFGQPESNTTMNPWDEVSRKNAAH
jgi:hypothetical protein